MDSRDDVAAPVVALLDRLTGLLEQARSLPLSASCVVNRSEALALVEELRRAMPEALGRASDVLDDKQGVVQEGRAEAERLVEAAREEQRSLLAETEVHRSAEDEARRIVQEAEAQAEAVRREVEEYVDAKLANFEVVLSKTLGAVQRGRARLHGESELDELAGDDAELGLLGGDRADRS